MDEADLVGVHEAGVAHHVAAVGEVDGEDRAAAVRDGGGAVVVELLVVVGADVAAGEDLFEVAHHRRIDGHEVLEVAVDRAVLDHEDLAVALDDLGLDLADLLVEKDLVRQLAVDDLLTDLGDALGAEGVGGAGPAEGRLLLLVALEKRLVGPLGGEALVGADGVQLVEYCPARACSEHHTFFEELNRFSHFPLSLLRRVHCEPRPPHSYRSSLQG